MTIDELSHIKGYEEITSSLCDIKDEMEDVAKVHLENITSKECVHIEDEFISYIEFFSKVDKVEYLFGYKCIDDKTYHRVFDMFWNDIDIDLDKSLLYENEIAEGIAEDLGYDISMEEISGLYKKFLSSVKHVKDNGSTGNKF